jgi:hypothetical protein
MNHEDSEMMKVLETIADRLVDMHLANQRQFAELAAQLKSLLPAEADDQLSLLDMVKAAAPKAVVPNEDEAMPVVDAQLPLVADPSWEVLASCPSCTTKAYTEKGVEEMFGYRTPAGRKTIVQSWCRYCRIDGKGETIQRAKLPDSVTKFWREADLLRKQADAKRDERTKCLKSTNGRETKQSLALFNQEHDLRMQVRKLVAQYDSARRAFRKGENGGTNEN